MDRVKIFALGGLDENGKNLFVVEINDDIFVVDAGCKYPNVTTPGVDYIIPNVNYLIQNKSRIKAYLLTHGHHEAIGALSFFYKHAPAPIYGSHTTISIGKNVFKTLKLPKCDFDNREIKPTDKIKVAGRDIFFFQTVSSMAESSGIAISTDLGDIVFLSDFICEYNSNNFGFMYDLKALSFIAERKSLILLCDSINANRKGYTSPFHKMESTLNSGFEKAQGRIYVGTFISSTYTLNEIINVSLSHKKKIAYFDSTTETFMKLYEEIGFIKIPTQNKIPISDIAMVKENELVLLKLDIGENLYDIAMKIAKKEYPDPRFFLTKNDTFFLCAPAGDNIEPLMIKSINELFKTDANIYYFTKKDVVRMHPSEEDIKFMISAFKPKYYMPIRGSYSDLLANAKLALSMNVGLNYSNIFVVDNGMVISFDENGKAKIDTDNLIDATDFVVDGTGGNYITTPAIKERVRMSGDGIIVIAGVISKKAKAFISKPDCQMRGFSFASETEPLIKLVTGIYIEEIVQALKDNRYKREDVIEKIKERTIRSIRKATKRNPKVIPTIYEID